MEKFWRELKSVTLCVVLCAIAIGFIMYLVGCTASHTHSHSRGVTVDSRLPNVNKYGGGYIREVPKIEKPDWTPFPRRDF